MDAGVYRALPVADDGSQTELPQSFTFMTRRHMPRRGQGLQLQERAPTWMRINNFQTSLDNTFAMVKDNMAAKNFSHHWATTARSASCYDW